MVGSLFEFPNTVDNRVIRLVAVQASGCSILQASLVTFPLQPLHELWAAWCLGRDLGAFRLPSTAAALTAGAHGRPRTHVPALACIVNPSCGLRSAQSPFSPQVFFISLFLAIFAYKKEQSWHWVAVGLLTDFCLRFYVSRRLCG